MLVDGHALVREGVRCLLASDGRCEIVGEAPTEFMRSVR